MIRNLGRFASCALLAASATTFVLAQTQAPTTPTQAPTTPKQVPPAPPQGATSSQEPAAPSPAQAPKFPAPDPKNFTSSTPTQDEVNDFLKVSWGYDENRVWEVAAILKTPVDGLSKVIVYVGDKSGKEKPGAFGFFVLPGGKYIISGEEVFPFGGHPYAETRAKLAADADGPYRGSADKTLELVEFADFQCPHCKEAQANMDKLATDFPKARIVFQNYPLERIHPEAQKAAQYGVCVAKLGGNHAFFQFADAVFEGQDGLNTADGAQLTLNSAVTKAGLDPAKVETCMKDPVTAQEVEKSVKLAQEVNVNQTPMLMVDGRPVPVGGVAYDTVKKIVDFQAKLDGVTQ